MVASAGSSFGNRVQEYMTGRPDYPDALLADLPLDTARDIIDLGAGTGKFTRQIAAPGRTIVAVEPDARMAAQIDCGGPATIKIVQASAESMPLPDASADLICCATAFHWFDYGPASAEIARILRSAGHLAVFWNVRDNRVPWVAALTRLLDRYAGDAPRQASGKWRAIFNDPHFLHVRTATYDFAQTISPEGIYNRVLWTSFIAALAPSEQHVVRGEVDAIIAGDATLRYAKHAVFPYRTELYLFQRV